ncbi:hypothetical protein CA13_30390 [Planctomycetes bacterium CA13]|uniref:Agarase n=1 Tax=Novipirellula herctigrandis TaxID=2527986 RepID=A0A5C5Z3M2_9BACT|nr:hypothetical protein CA13_30390 [Planctomycetes bacterium CA13]
MKRREFVRLGAASSLNAGLFGMATTSAADATVKLDRFGGWTAKKFDATGFFRVEKADRWWLVTPEGNAFLSWGINHLHPDLWNQDYNREAWQKTLGLQKLYGPEFNAALRSWFMGICDRFGFNTVGVHTSLNIVNQPQPQMAYMQPIRFVDLPHWKPDIPDSNFMDLFSPEFASHCDGMAKKMVLPIKDDPFLLGYTMTDCTLFTEEDLRERPDVIGGKRRESRVGWPRRLRNMGAKAAGKKAYVQTMRNLYRDSIGDFNTTYGTPFDSFDALATAEHWRPQTQLSNANETRDNIEFLQRCVGKYYQTARDAIRRYDTHHMFVGDKINANTDSLDTVLPITSQYTDLIFYQMYGRYEVQKPGLDRWSKLTDKPFINGDSAFTMTTDIMPRPYGPVADNLQQRAEWTAEFFHRAFERPDFVGWHYCGLIDAPILVPRKASRQHSGLLNGFGDAYPQLEKILKECAGDIYNIAKG